MSIRINGQLDDINMIKIKYITHSDNNPYHSAYSEQPDGLPDVGNTKEPPVKS